MKPCLDCGTLSDRNRCPAHRRVQAQARDARRGGTAARGYGATHQRQREEWRPYVDAGTVLCRRCDEPIRPGSRWDLGHPDEECPAPLAPEHADRCNRAAGGRDSRRRHH